MTCALSSHLHQDLHSITCILSVFSPLQLVPSQLTQPPTTAQADVAEVEQPAVAADGDQQEGLPVPGAAGNRQQQKKRIGRRKKRHGGGDDEGDDGDQRQQGTGKHLPSREVTYAGRLR